MATTPARGEIEHGKEVRCSWLCTPPGEASSSITQPLPLPARRGGTGPERVAHERAASDIAVDARQVRYTTRPAPMFMWPTLGYCPSDRPAG